MNAKDAPGAVRGLVSFLSFFGVVAVHEPGSGQRNHEPEPNRLEVVLGCSVLVRFNSVRLVILVPNRSGSNPFF